MPYHPRHDTLIPAQQRALESLEQAIRTDGVVVLMGRAGCGKSTILRALHARLGGAMIGAREIIEASATRDPLALEETSYQVIAAALAGNPAVIVDDFYYVSLVSCCSHAYPRNNFIAAALAPLAERARADDKVLIVAGENVATPGLTQRVPTVGIPNFTVDDYSALCAHYLGDERAAALDVRKIHRFAPRLTARQLADSCVALRDRSEIDTEMLITYLREHHMVRNVDLD
jgi:ABC-type cobalamin transport system ATPase subunit